MKGIIMAQVKFSLKCQENTFLQLKFKKGDIITITQKEDGEQKRKIIKCTLQNDTLYVRNFNLYAYSICCDVSI